MKFNFKTILGISLILLAVFITSDTTYTFIKSLLVGNGSSIWFAVLFTWSLIGTSLLCGVVLLNGGKSKNNSGIKSALTGTRT